MFLPRKQGFLKGKWAIDFPGGGMLFCDGMKRIVKNSVFIGVFCGYLSARWILGVLFDEESVVVDLKGYGFMDV